MDLLNNSMVSGLIVAIVLSLGGVLIKVLTLWSAKLTQLIELTNAQTVKVDAVGLTALKTETLVNSQRSELKAEIENLKTRLDASHLAKDVASETASKVAAQTAKDMAEHLTRQLQLTAELATAVGAAKHATETTASLALAQATTPAAQAGGGQVVTIPSSPAQVVPVEQAQTPALIVRP